MPKLIIHKNGAYNLYSTVVDAPVYESALTIEQLIDVTFIELGISGLKDLPLRLGRAHKTGCSHVAGFTLEDCIISNRAGENESNIPVDDFIKRFLTLEAQP